MVGWLTGRFVTSITALALTVSVFPSWETLCFLCCIRLLWTNFNTKPVPRFNCGDKAKVEIGRCSVSE